MDGIAGCSYFKIAAKFCNELDKTKNSVFSPLLTAELVKSGNALKSILQVENVQSKGVQTSDDTILSSFHFLPTKFKSIRGLTFNRGSKIFLNVEHEKLDRKKKRSIKQNFCVNIKNIDLANSAGADAIINKWLEKKTKIKGDFSHNDFGAHTSVIHISGLYFKGLWHMKFDPDNTEESLFHLNNNETVNVFLMYRKEKYNYKESPHLEAQLLLLPFKSKEAHMLIVLPNRVTGLNKVLQILAEGHDLMAEVAEMSNNYEVEVSIPRFKIESEINVLEVLHKLGVTTTFDKAVQKVLICVNEEGAEPKPERMKCRFIPRWKPRPIEFTANRPHLILIIYENVPIIWVTFRGRFD